MLAYQNQNTEDGWQTYRFCHEQLASISKDKNRKTFANCLPISEHSSAKTDTDQQVLGFCSVQTAAKLR